nr:hypothetical protein [Alkalibacillus aidingensis]
MLPIVASIGVGAVTYSMMTGKAGQLQNVLPSLSKMSGNGQNSQDQNQPSQDVQLDQQGQQSQYEQQLYS